LALLQDLENSLLLKLANAQGDILEDIELIENLEQTKRTAVDIEEKVKMARQTEVRGGLRPSVLSRSRVAQAL
jgi:dynein heavy chain